MFILFHGSFNAQQLIHGWPPLNSFKNASLRSVNKQPMVLWCLLFIYNGEYTDITRFIAAIWGAHPFGTYLLAKYSIITLKAQHVVTHLLSSRHNHPASSITLWGANHIQKAYEAPHPTILSKPCFLRLIHARKSAVWWVGPGLEFLHGNPEYSKWVILEKLL